MFTLRYFLLVQFELLINSKQLDIVTSNDHQPLDIESSVIDIRIPDVDTCLQSPTDDCKILIHQMIKCQEVIFNDPGFSYQQYKENIHVHRQILAKYQTMCEITQKDYLANSLFDFKKD